MSHDTLYTVEQALEDNDHVVDWEKAARHRRRSWWSARLEERRAQKAIQARIAELADAPTEQFKAVA